MELIKHEIARILNIFAESLFPNIKSNISSLNNKMATIGGKRIKDMYFVALFERSIILSKFFFVYCSAKVGNNKEHIETEINSKRSVIFSGKA